MTTARTTMNYNEIRFIAYSAVLRVRSGCFLNKQQARDKK